MHWQDIAEIATVIALVLAVWQSMSAYYQTKALKIISGHVSTKYLSEFPEYISELPSLIDSTKKSLHIACDAPCISIFSNYSYWKLYQRAIEDLADSDEDIEITLTVLNEELAKKLIREQFNSAHLDFDSWKKKPENMRKIEIAAEKTNYEKKISSDQMIIDDLVNILLKADELAIQNTFRGAKVKRSKVPMTTYYWISDETKAIFAIPQFGDDSVTEKSFQTNDQALIKSFRSITNRYQQGLDGD